MPAWLNLDYVFTEDINVTFAAKDFSSVTDMVECNVMFVVVGQYLSNIYIALSSCPLISV